MTPTTILLWAVLVPGALTLVATLVSVRYATRALAAWAVALGVAVAYVVGQLGMVGWQGFDGDITHLLLPLAAAGALAGGVEQQLRASAWRWALRVVVSVVSAWLLLRPLLPASALGQGVAGNAISPLSLPGVALSMLALWSALDRLAERDQGRLLPALVVLLSSLGGVTVLFAGNATTGALSGPLAAAAGAIMLVGLFRPRAALLRPAVPVLAILSAGQWAIGRFYTDNMGTLAVALLAGGPVLLALALPSLQPLRRAIAVTVQVIALLLPAGAAAGMAAIGYFAPPPPSSAPVSGSSRAPSQPHTDDDYGY